MKTKRDFRECDSALQLLRAVGQNTIIDLLNEGAIVSSLHAFKYLNSEPLANSLLPSASNKKVARSLMEVCRYFVDREEYQLIGFFFAQEMQEAIKLMGKEIHEIEKERYGGTFKH